MRFVKLIIESILVVNSILCSEKTVAPNQLTNYKFCNETLIVGFMALAILARKTVKRLKRVVAFNFDILSKEICYRLASKYRNAKPFTFIILH